MNLAGSWNSTVDANNMTDIVMSIKQTQKSGHPLVPIQSSIISEKGDFERL